MNLGLQKFVDGLRSHRTLTASRAVTSLQDFASAEALLSDISIQDLPDDRYSRIVLHQDRGFELVLAVWPPLRQTLVHDHGSLSSQGAVRVLRGRLFNSIYRRHEGDQVIEAASEECHRGDLIKVSQGLIHAMGNPDEQEWAMSLHLYAPVIVDVRYWDPATLQRVA